MADYSSLKKIHQYFKRAVVIELTAVCNWYAIHKSRHEKSYTAGVLHDFAISIQIQWHSFLYICPIHLSYLYKIWYSIVKLILDQLLSTQTSCYVFIVNLYNSIM